MKIPDLPCNLIFWLCVVPIMFGIVFIVISVAIGDELTFGQEYCNTLYGDTPRTTVAAARHSCDYNQTDHRYTFNKTRLAELLGNVQT